MALHSHANLPGPTEGRASRVDLAIEGMTCASCAAAVERAIGRSAGVSKAAVNFSTRTATVHYDPMVTGPESLAGVVRDAGYEARTPSGPVGSDAAHDAEHAGHMLANADEQRALVRGVIVGAVLSLPVLVIAMSHGTVPWLAGPWTNWVQLVLATPV